MTTPPDTPFRYEDAVAEIYRILDQIDEGEAGIDDLGPMVERASALIQQCRAKLSATEMQVHEALEGLKASLGDEDPS